jgi:PIN domain nuclease of toxin-antitoxin system
MVPFLSTLLYTIPQVSINNFLTSAPLPVAPNPPPTWAKPTPSPTIPAPNPCCNSSNKPSKIQSDLFWFSTMDWQSRITLDPNILTGKPIIKGTRLASDPRLSGAIATLIEVPDNTLSVSIASLWEMAIKIGIGKLEIDRPLGNVSTALEELGIHFLPITPREMFYDLENPYPGTISGL